MWVKVKKEDVVLDKGKNLLLIGKVQDVHVVCSGNRGCQVKVKLQVCVRSLFSARQTGEDHNKINKRGKGMDATSQSSLGQCSVLPLPGEDGSPLRLAAEPAFGCTQHGTRLKYLQPVAARLKSLLGTASRSFHLRQGPCLCPLLQRAELGSGWLGGHCSAWFISVLCWYTFIRFLHLNIGKEFCDLESFWQVWMSLLNVTWKKWSPQLPNEISSF